MNINKPMKPIKRQFTLASLLLTALYTCTTSIAIAVETTGTDVKSPSSIENATINQHPHGSMHDMHHMHQQSNPANAKTNSELQLKQEKQHDHKSKDMSSITEATLHSHKNTQ